MRREAVGVTLCVDLSFYNLTSGNGSEGNKSTGTPWPMGSKVRMSSVIEQLSSLLESALCCSSCKSETNGRPWADGHLY